MTVTVYTTGPACQACKLTKDLLWRIGVEYTEKPIDDEISAIVAERGFKSAPVVHVAVDGQEPTYWDGFRPDRLRELVSL